MKKILLLVIVTISTLNCYSQISFEKGYYINNFDQKIDCLIKNIDWKDNPTEFEYKLTEEDASKSATIKSVKEFGVYNVSKHIKSTVNIDRSSNDLKNLSTDKNPIFKEEVLFLKVLVDGKSNLYQYVEGNLKRYFYNTENSIIEQLIYKSYKSDQTILDNIGKNNKFRQQLWANLKCENFKMSTFKNVNYTKKDLTRFFIQYNECNNSDLITFEPKKKRDLFNLTIRPRLNKSSLAIQKYEPNRFTSGLNKTNIDFDTETGFGFGLEAEFVLPFNKNKWAITIEPTYQNFKSEKTINISNVSGGKLTAKLDYSSIELPIGLRHYFFLNKNSKIFMNASYVFDFSSKSLVKLTRTYGTGLEPLGIKTENNLAFGIGYKQNDKYSLEIRYQTSREILSNYIYWTSEYNTLSVIFGYSLF